MGKLSIEQHQEIAEKARKMIIDGIDEIAKDNANSHEASLYHTVSIIAIEVSILVHELISDLQENLG